MRSLIYTLPTLLIFACSPSASDKLPEEVSDSSLVGMIKSGEARACSADDVKSTVINALLPEYEPEGDLLQDDIDVGIGKIDISLSAISLAGKDASIGSVTCDANVGIKVPGASKFEQAISYTVRPSAESDDSFIIQGDYGSAGRRVAQLASALVSRAMHDRIEAERASAIETEVAEEDAQAPRDQTLVGNNYLEEPEVNEM